MIEAQVLSPSAPGAVGHYSSSPPVAGAGQSRKIGELFPGAGLWVALVILTMPIRDVALGSLDGANLRIGDIVLALAIGLWVLAGVERGRMTIQWNRLDSLLVLFVVLNAVSLIWSNESYHGEIRVLKLFRNLGMYLLFVNFLRPDAKSGFRTLAVCFVISGLMQGTAFLVSIAQAGGLGAINEILSASTLLSNDTRLSVVKTNNGAGLFLKGAAGWMPLGMFFGFAGAYLLKKRMGDLAMRGSAVVLGLLTVLTMSRTAWVGMAAGFVAREVGLGVRAIFRRLPLLAAAAMVVFLAGWYPTIARVVRGRFPDTVLSDNSVTERLYYFDIAWQTFLARPLLGGGVAGISSEEFVIAHSVYLQVLGELGLVGTLLMLTIFWLWASFLFRVCRIAKQSGDRRLQAAGAAMLGLAAFFLVSFIFAYDLEGGEPFIAMAMSSALYSSGWVATRRREIHARRQEQLARRQQQRLRRKARLETAAAAPS